ncbi:MAG: T9SS type A sorting domain-containing protein [Flavobacteriaceae bacterium]|jgi:hypothetical protein|nr:T9SS type A sorting domain-containing protein [Flavobacteriaceae bacterium]
MKNIFISLSIFVAFFAKAQQSELINNIWYLEKVIINGTEHYAPTSNPLPQMIQTNFSDNQFLTTVCVDFFGAEVSYTSTEITIQSAAIGLSDCPQFPDYNDFKNLYYFPVLSDGMTQFPYELDFLIENAGDYKRLTLTNPAGNTAIYNNIILSATDFNKTNDITLFPNPATNILNIETSQKISGIIIYDASGKMVKTVQNTGKTIDISTLQNGVYHLEIFTDKGKIYKKFVVNN